MKAFLDFSKGNFVPKFCQPNRPQTKGKVERFNRYLKENFFIPLKASLKGSGIEITSSLLNTHIFSWIEKSNERIHATTKEKPAKRLMKERRYLTPYLPKVVKPLPCLEEKVSTPTIPKMDINYFTTLSDYERILLQGGTYAS